MSLLRAVLFLVLIPLSLFSATCLYLYPVLQGCAFPLPKLANAATNKSVAQDELTWWTSSLTLENGVLNTLFQHAADWSSTLRIDNINNINNNSGYPEPAIFRLLVLADPQIEGDSSLPSPDDELGPRLRRHWVRVWSVLVDGLERDDNEGDSSSSFHFSFPFVVTVLKETTHTVLFEDLPATFQAARKRLDLLGNDYYLAHIYRTLSWWSRPTHVTVLGDLIGSQWVTDAEFENRGRRFWDRVFRGGERVEDDMITSQRGEEKDSTDAESRDNMEMETLQRYNSSWTKRIINIAGNHDIGYAGDVSKQRLDRFERVFGRANWDIRFAHPPLDLGLGLGNEEKVDSTPRLTLHIINLNDLTLDGPPFDQSIQSDSYAYINDVLSHRSYPVEDQTSFTLLLTHVPLHKREGVCVDSPYFTYFEEDDNPENSEEEARFRKDGLREQNHLSEHVSTNGILEGLFGMSGDTASAPANGKGRRGLILTGHDHEGCDVIHFVNRTDSDSAADAAGASWHWDATRYNGASTSSDSATFITDDGDTPFIREVTLRSMMGEYSGNAALLSLWFDPDPGVNRWRYEIQMCPAGVQHIWWAVHGLAFACLLGMGLVVGLWVWDKLQLLVIPSRRNPVKGNPVVKKEVPSKK